MIHIPRNHFVFVLFTLWHMNLSGGSERSTVISSIVWRDDDVESTQDPGSGYFSISLGYDRTNQFSDSRSSSSLETTTKARVKYSDDEDFNDAEGETGSDEGADFHETTPVMRTSKEQGALTAAPELGINLESEGPCSKNRFGCDNGKCIHKMFQCSAEHLRQCANDSGLNNCSAPEAGKCRGNEFKCRNGKCIHRSYMCDGQTDCEYGDTIDEENCKDVRCGEYEFQCTSRACIPDSHRCNGDPFDCFDGDDEKNCTSCTYGAFKCTTENVCILESRRCDSVFDCPDGSDESQVHCPNGTTPPEWTEFWHDDPKKARNISLAYSDEHVVFYFGQEMRASSTTWPFLLLSQAWEHMTRTYADISRQSRLLVLLHQSRTTGCERRTFGGFPSRNLISCGTNVTRGWATQTALKFEALFLNFAEIRLNSDKELSFNEEGNQSGRCSDVRNLIFYDIYRHLGKTSTHLPPWNYTMLKEHVGGNPNETTCFRDWFFPIYESYGGSTLIQSEAAGTDLQPMAARVLVFSWSANDQRDLLSARRRHPLDLSYIRNAYVVTYADEHVEFYMRNHLNDFVVSPLYEALSKSWKYLKSVYGPFPRTYDSIFFVWQDGEWEERNRSCIDLESTQTFRNSSDSPPLRFLYCSYSTALPNSSRRASSSLYRVFEKMGTKAVNLNYRSRSPSPHIPTSPLLDNPQWGILKNIVSRDIDFHLYWNQRQNPWSDLSVEIRSEFNGREPFWYSGFFRTSYDFLYWHHTLGKLMRDSHEIAILLRAANASKFNVGDFIHALGMGKEGVFEFVDELGWNKLNESLLLEQRRLLPRHFYSDLRCPEGEFTCMNLRCVPAPARCDGVLNCADGSDEEDCTNCTSTAFKCPVSDICIKGASQLCNFRVDCPDGSDESKDTCPDGNTPLFLKLGPEERLAERQFLSLDLGVYFGEEMNSSLSPHFPHISQAWGYVKETLIPEGDPHLIILLQHSSFSSCSAFTQFDQEFGYRNLINCEKAPRNSTDQFPLVLGALLKLVSTAVFKKKDVKEDELCELEIGILCFTCLHTTRRGNETDEGEFAFSSWWNQVVGQVSNSSDCFQHWLNPIYHNYGGSQVLDRFCSLMRLDWPPQSGSTQTAITSNAARLVHFWSEAAGTDLEEFANTAFSSSNFDHFKDTGGFIKLVDARQEFYSFNYTVMNYTHAYSDDRMLFYYRVNFPSPPLPYEDISRAWGRVHSVVSGSSNAPPILVFLENARAAGANKSFLRMCVRLQSATNISAPHPDRHCGKPAISSAFPSDESKDAQQDAFLTQMALLGLELHHADKYPTSYAPHQLLTSILVYDIYTSHFWQTNDAQRWVFFQVSKEEPLWAGGHTLRFSNWYYPIYRYHGGLTALTSFFRHWNSIKLWPTQGFRKNASSDLNPGEFVHLWSLAVNFNLQNFANASLGGSWDESFQTMFATARRTGNSKRGYSSDCPARFLCDLHRCIRTEEQCDGNSNCVDGSDEEDCAESGCRNSAFLCQNGQCISKLNVCDGTPNCGDKSDETNCEQCNWGAFKCDTGTYCIESRRVCDSTSDCLDGSDENQVQCSATTTFANFTPSATSSFTEKPGAERFLDYSATKNEPNYQNVRFELRGVEPTVPILQYYEQTSKAWQYARDNFGAFAEQTHASLLVILENTSNKSTEAPHCFSNVEKRESNEININCRFSSTLHPKLEAFLLLQETVKQMGVALLPGNGTDLDWFYSHAAELAISSIIAYDIQLAGLGETEEILQRFANSLKKKEVPSGDGIDWFRDWYFPLYVLHGNSTVLLKALHILNTQFYWGAQANITGEARAPINKGELVHIWSGAVGLSLREIAQVTLNWKQENDQEFYKAREKYVNITYEFVNPDIEVTNITHAQSNAQILAIVEKSLGRAQLLKNVYADEHLSIFFDSSIPPTVDWPFSLLSTYWRYMKLFPNKLQSSKPHLNVIFHDKLEKNCTYSESFEMSGQLFSNTIDCGHKEGSGDTWAQETLQNLEIVTTTSTVRKPSHVSVNRSEVLHPNASHENNRAEDIPFSLAGHALFHMFVFDRYLQDMRLEDAHSWLLDKGELIRVAEFNSHFWFKDWLLPLYSKYGGVLVLDRFVLLSETRKRMLRATQNTSLVPTDVRMNLGELVHVWESAAGASLRDMAIKIHGWNDDTQKQFCNARAALPFNSSTSEGDDACDQKSTPDFLKKNLFLIIIPSLAALFVFGCLGCGLKMFIYERRIQMLGQQIRDLTKEEVYQFFNGGAGGEGAGNGPIHAMPFDSQYELPREDFVIDKDRVLGSGEFGVVHYGTLKRPIKPETGTVGLSRNDAEFGTEVAVAIKTVKPNVEVSLFKALLMEIKIMGHLGSHPNVTSLLGTFTQNIKNRELYVILEFCAKGDLLHVLKNGRAQFCNLFKLTDEASTNSAPTAACNQMPHLKVVSNNSEAAVAVAVEMATTPATNTSDPSYENETDLTSAALPISTRNLIDWSIQIAQGMSYLASKQVIHGDLAARNVLLTVENVAKISDFGLSRQLVNYSNYMKTSKTPLPWRWLAVESLTDMEFSLQSDIWAFGVTLWEIFTLGKLPYPGRTWDHEFVNELVAGQRLNAPEFGDLEIFNCILDCMKTDPAQRASPNQIAARLKRIAVYARAHAPIPTTGDQSGNYLTLVAPNETQ